MGFYFDNNENCVECSLNKKSTGCMSCNPVNETECFLCAEDYYQESLNGECLLLETP